MWPSTPTNNQSIQQLRKERGWRLWLAPRPFTLISFVYLIFPLVLVGGFGLGEGNSWAIVLTIGVLLALLALDRLDYWLFGEVPPTVAGIILLVVRFLLVEAVAQYGNFGAAIWLYAMLPSIGSNYFGPRGAYLTGVIIWISFLVRTTLSQTPLDWSDRNVVGSYIGSIVAFSFLLVFVVTMARIVWEEKASRIRAESLLAELQRSHGRLKEYSEQAIAATEDRNRVASQIHNTLGHYLAVINVQLEKALAFRDRDPQAAEQAVRDGKHLASEALHDVRRSVGALRSYPAMLQPPEAIEAESKDQTPGSGNPRSGIRMWLAPRPFDVVTAAVYIGLLIMDLGWGDADNADTIISWRSLLWGCIAFSLIALDRLDYRLFGEVPPAKAGILFMALRCLLIMAVGVSAGWWYTTWLIPLLIHTGFTYFGSRGGYVVAALTTTGLLASVINSAQDSGQLNVNTLFSGIILVAIMALMMAVTARTALKERTSRMRSEELIAQIEDEHQQLQVYSEQTLATIQERNHLAREIHDGLGHYLTVVNVQLEKALAFRTLDPQVADQAIRDAKRLTSEALQDVRVTMGSLQPSHESFALRPAVKQLVNNMANSIEVDVHIDGRDAGFSQQSLMALYRAVQEGLTNIQKHSKAREAFIRISLGDSNASLDLSDNGRGFDPNTLEDAGGEHSERYGLKGVRERLQLIGGSMEVVSKVGEGTSLHVTVPRDLAVFAHARKQLLSVPGVKV